MKRKLLQVALTLTILSITSVLGSNVLASNITNLTKEVVVNTEDVILDEITYKNDSDKEEKIKITVSSYDAKEQKVLSTKPFAGVGTSLYTVKAKKEIKITYAASIPKDTPIGTYFNVIFFQKVNPKKPTENVTLEPSIGALLVFHVQNSTSTIEKIFFDDSDIKIVVEKKGLPYISPTVFKYTYTNNSNYVFKPTGEIRILDANEQQILNRYEINEEGKNIYPGKTIEKEVTVNLWNNIKDITSQKNIVSRTYSNVDSTPIMNKVAVSVLYQVGLIGIIALVIIIATLYLIISGIVAKAKKRS